MRRQPQLTGRALFAAVAPTLERAHRERRAELARLRDQRSKAADRVLHCKWLVAHRDLQYHRACAKGRKAAKYADRRLRMLRAAEAELAQAERRAAELDAAA